MANDRVRTYTVRELERQATDYLARQFGADVLIPVDVDLLVEKTEGLILDVWPKLQANHKESKVPDPNGTSLGRNHLTSKRLRDH